LPIFIFLTLLGVKGCSIDVDPSKFPPRFRKDNKIDRDILLLPEILLDNYDFIAEYILQESFDSFWNACGFSRSFNYDENGKWLGNKF